MLRFGAELAATLQGGEIIALCGGLGAGKTMLTKGIVGFLSENEDVASPTFTLIHEYRSGKLPVVHADLYRIDSAEAAERAGLLEAMDGEAVVIVEWADKFPDLIPAEARWIRIRILDDERHREIEL